MIVLDASAVLDLVLRRHPRASWVDRRLGVAGESVHAPHVIDIEVATTIRRYVFRGLASEARAERALEAYVGLDVARYPHAPLLGRIWGLRHNLTISDAAYVALAEALDCPLVTTDAALARSSGHRARVEAYPGG